MRILPLSSSADLEESHLKLFLINTKKIYPPQFTEAWGSKVLSHRGSALVALYKCIEMMVWKIDRVDPPRHDPVRRVHCRTASCESRTGIVCGLQANLARCPFHFIRTSYSHLFARPWLASHLSDRVEWLHRVSMAYKALIFTICICVYIY